MGDQTERLQVQASHDLLEVRGLLSRTEWELVYLAASKLALEHGLSIEHFGLQSVELDQFQRPRESAVEQREATD
jgi:hypothetical protein